MKKALALVLALVLALSMGVSAFAATLNVVTLKPATEASATVIDISDPKYQLGQDADYGTKYLVGPEGGKFYVTLDGTKEYKNIEVTANGIVSAKVVDYDPEEYTGADTLYRVEVKGTDGAYELTSKEEKAILAELKEDLDYHMPNGDYSWIDKDGKLIELGDDKSIKNWLKANEDKGLADAFKHFAKEWSLDKTIVGLVEGTKFDKANLTSYEFNKELAEELNDLHQTNRFVVDNYDLENVYVIELTVEKNYSAAYKTGSVKITADEVVDTDRYGRDETEPVSGTISIVSDVAIFEYEMVKWAGKTENALLVNVDEGYSDYLTALKGYGKEYNEDALRYDDATVVSTTAFRALAEKDYALDVEAGRMYVEIEEIAASQKGVNFAFKDVTAVYDLEWPYDFLHVQFGFYGDQVIASDFTITVDLGMDVYELRELYGLKVEEDDIISYYVVDENDKLVKEIKVDYMTADIDKNLVIEIEGKAGDTLGMYKVLLEVPAAETEGEENPNTGAESVVGVVAALAVVSVATAAAVSLKK